MSETTEKILSPRESGRFISFNCDVVGINNDKVKETAKVLAETFKRENFTMEGYKKHTLHPKVADEKAVSIIFAIDVLNFCFWPDVPGKTFLVEYDGKPYTGYWSLVAALRRAEDEGKPIYNAEFMANIDEEEFNEIFRSDSEVAIPLLPERLKAFRECGSILLSKFGGTFVNCVRQCNKDAVTLLKLIVDNFPCFRDESTFNEQRVAFYKRAQIVIGHIWCCFEGRGLGEFKNINEITMFADYRVPQSLEYFGILKYSEKLKKVLSERTILPPGHRYELEIRGSSIESVERLTAEVKSILRNEGEMEEKLVSVNAVTVDKFLWEYACAHQNEMNHLDFHLVRTIYY